MEASVNPTLKSLKVKNMQPQRRYNGLPQTSMLKGPKQPSEVFLKISQNWQNTRVYFLIKLLWIL